jgi:hypothetical protein
MNSLIDLMKKFTLKILVLLIFYGTIQWGDRFYKEVGTL